MRRTPGVRAYRHVVTAIATIIAPSIAAAQTPFTIGSLTFAWMDASSNVNLSCQTTSQLYSATPNDGSLHCTGPDMTGDGRWSTTFGGPLRIQTSVNAANAPAYYADMSGQSYFNDFLQFTGEAVPTAVRFTVHESGSITGNPDLTEATLAVTSQIAGFGGARCDGTDPTSTVTYTASFNTSRTALCTFTGSWLNFGYSLTASAAIDVGRLNGVLRPPLLSGSADVDVFNTGLIEGLAFYDANGTDITDNVQFTSASGAAYPTAAVTATPEPTSLTLLATGIAGLFGAVRRKRRPSRDV